MHRLLLILALCGLAVTVQAETKTALFAGGCFWCMQQPFDQVKGVTRTVVGYTGGSKEDANYTAVSAHQTQHREAIEITYDPAQVTYDQLLDVFWHNIRPTQGDGQFHDIGLSYQASIYYGSEEEKNALKPPKKKLAMSGKFDQPIVTEILAAKPFYPAEEYHQKYYQKNPAAYEAYHIGSGRVSYLDKIWGKS